MKRYLLMLAAGLVSQALWAAPGTMIKDEDLRATPSSAAAKVASVSKGAVVEVLLRQGGWTQVRYGGSTGWVRILSVRTSVTTGSVGDVAALASRREGQVVAVAGLRGLNEEELKGARFDAKELKLLNSFRAKPAAARSFAQAAGLEARDVAYLPEPKAEAGGNGGDGFPGGGQ
ncbi:MAG: SH3 domain-containing protein [Thiobacillus sp.]|nr:SH3 domain-containing protein [Thiobacillus sp.]